MLDNKKILVVEDDRHVCELVEATFSLQNANVTLCNDGQTAVEMVKEDTYDLIILDIMLPNKDGLEVCRELRAGGFDMPIIMLTAKVEELDKVLGLELGADDYVTKPFSPKELVARCRAALRRFSRSKEIHKNQFVFNNLVIKKDQYEATYKGQVLDFTRREFELICFLAEHPRQTFTRDQVLSQVWGFASSPETRTVDEHVKRIRRKLELAQIEDVGIKTIWGIGYQFEVAENA